MNVTFRQLQVFEAVARHLSYTRAAEALHLTQPAVSMQIRQLEEAAGVALFAQHGKKISLTPAGEELRHYSRQIQQLLRDASDALEAHRTLQRGRLAVTVASTANHFAARLIGEFSKAHPGVTITLDVTNRERLLAQLENNEPDLVIMGEPPQGLDLTSERLMENPLVLVASPGHALAGRRRIPLAEVSREQFVVRESGSGTRNAIERFLQAHGLSLAGTLEMSSNEAIKHAVEAGLGLGIVSRHTIELELAAGRLVVLDVEGFPILRHWHIVTRRGKRLSPIARAFRDFLREKAPRYVSARGVVASPA